MQKHLLVSLQDSWLLFHIAQDFLAGLGTTGTLRFTFPFVHVDLEEEIKALLRLSTTAIQVGFASPSSPAACTDALD